VKAAAKFSARFFGLLLESLPVLDILEVIFKLGATLAALLALVTQEVVDDPIALFRKFQITLVIAPLSIKFLCLLLLLTSLVFFFLRLR
jgi:hypothetical protein